MLSVALVVLVGAWVAFLPAAQARIWGAKANRAVAASSSQGTTLRKMSSGVNSSKAAPAAPPTSDRAMALPMVKPGGAAMSSLKPQALAA